MMCVSTSTPHAQQQNCSFWNVSKSRCYKKSLDQSYNKNFFEEERTQNISGKRKCKLFFVKNKLIEGALTIVFPSVICEIFTQCGKV